jgi:hypothetical protein
MHLAIRFSPRRLKMFNPRKTLRFGLLLTLFALLRQNSFAQSLFVGATGIDSGPAPVAGVETFIQTGAGADRVGSVNLAGFSWSHAPCPAAVKIKFFRPADGGFVYIDQRGPFDVTSTQQRIRLDPPVPLRSGDLIAITNLTSCGGPVIAGPVRLPGPPPLPIQPPPYYALAGDVTSNVIPAAGVPTSGPAVTVFAVDQSLFLLNNRFRVTLLATNPRTGAVALGYPVANTYPVNGAFGFFSLPDFTFDWTLPEIMVKMVDATGNPALGGGFWVFQAPLTDLQYSMTVTDQATGRVRTYTNVPGGPGQLCGSVDTAAFPGP